MPHTQLLVLLKIELRAISPGKRRNHQKIESRQRNAERTIEEFGSLSQ
jgi:hypothetical protein